MFYNLERAGGEVAALYLNCIGAQGTRHQPRDRSEISHRRDVLLVQNILGATGHRAKTGLTPSPS